MPPIERVNRHDDAILWDVTGVDAYGEPLRDDPVELKVRWENNRSEMLDANGQSITVDATAVVAQDVTVGALMWQGLLDDWYGTGSSGSDNGLCQVVAFSKIPDLKGRNYRRTVGLMRFRGTLPALDS